MITPEFELIGISEYRKKPFKVTQIPTPDLDAIERCIKRAPNDGSIWTQQLIDYARYMQAIFKSESENNDFLNEAIQRIEERLDEFESQAIEHLAADNVEKMSKAWESGRLWTVEELRKELAPVESSQS